MLWRLGEECGAGCKKRIYWTLAGLRRLGLEDGMACDLGHRCRFLELIGLGTTARFQVGKSSSSAFLVFISSAFLRALKR